MIDRFETAATGFLTTTRFTYVLRNLDVSPTQLTHPGLNRCNRVRLYEEPKNATITNIGEILWFTLGLDPDQKHTPILITFTRHIIF
jgi:hypothetical protein